MLANSIRSFYDHPNLVKIYEIKCPRENSPGKCMVAYFAGMMLTCFGLGCKETASVVIFAPSSAEVCDFSDLLELGRICPLDRRGAPPGDIFVPLPERYSYLLTY